MMRRMSSLFRVTVFSSSRTVNMMVRSRTVNMMVRDGNLCCGSLRFHVLVVFCRRVLLRGQLMLLMFGDGTVFRGEMLRVSVVCSPKTFGKTIFHANSLSEDQGADASPTCVIRSTAA
ncbi:MAG TPA: hypothetical protein VMR25_28020 [Planctomycetaceae bacterium]|nr:hypothetical protein [Planctomycetaceae bacterium]